MRRMPLGDVADINPKVPKELRDSSNDVAFLGMADVSESGKARCRAVRPIAEVRKGYRYFERGDVLLAKITPCMENGKAAFVTDLPTQAGFGSTEFHVIRPTAQLDGRYAFYMVWNARFRSLAGRNMTGTAGQKRVPTDFLRRFHIPLPPLDEQRRIAAILDKADAIRRKRKEAIQLTEELLRSTFLEMFGDPVTNPMGWPTALFGEVGTLDRGKSRHRPRNDPALLGGPYPLIQTGEVSNSGGEIRSYTQSYSELGLAQSRMWSAGTLCITIAANIAQTGILTFDACFPDSVVGFHPGPTVTTEFVQGWLGFLQPLVEARAPQVAQKNINLRILRALEIPTPPVAMLKTHAEIVSAIRRSTARHRSAVAEADNLFHALVQRAFRGEL